MLHFYALVQKLNAHTGAERQKRGHQFALSEHSRTLVGDVAAQASHPVSQTPLD